MFPYSLPNCRACPDKPRSLEDWKILLQACGVCTIRSHQLNDGHGQSSQISLDTWPRDGLAFCVYSDMFYCSSFEDALQWLGGPKAALTPSNPWKGCSAMRWSWAFWEELVESTCWGYLSVLEMSVSKENSYCLTLRHSIWRHNLHHIKINLWLQVKVVLYNFIDYGTRDSF